MEPKVTIGSKKGSVKVSLQKSKTIPAPLSKLKLTQPDSKDQKISKEDKIYWRSSGSPLIRKKTAKRSKKPYFLSVLVSVVCAMVVGGVLGISMLSIFFANEPTYSKNSIDSHLPKAKSNKKETVQSKYQVYLLQAGSYQKRNRAEEKIRSYRKKGLAAVLSTESPYRIYLGVSLSQAGAQQLEKKYKQQGIHVYVKKTVISSTYHQDLKEFHRMLNQSKKIFNELSQASVKQMVHGVKETGSFTFRPQVMTQFQQVLEDAQKIKQKLSDQEQEKMMTMIRALDQAVQSAKEAKLHPSPPLMWQIQEGLVKYIVAYNQL